MQGARPAKKGSFGGRLDELVKHFPHDPPRRRNEERDDNKLREKRDIHAALFAHAWQMDPRQD